MRSKNYGINVRVTEQEKQKLLENARFCSLSLSEYLRRLGLGKEVRAAIAERDYRLFRMLNGLKAELPQLQKEKILSTNEGEEKSPEEMAQMTFNMIANAKDAFCQTASDFLDK